MTFFFCVSFFSLQQEQLCNAHAHNFYDNYFLFFMCLFLIFFLCLQQEHLSNAEDFYDDSLFDLVDMLEEVFLFVFLDLDLPEPVQTDPFFDICL
jgi:hypothetical protein